MHVVHVANFYGPASGGLRTTMHALGAGYLAAGHEVTMVVPGAEAADERTPWGRRVTLPGRRIPRSGGYRVITDVDVVCALLDELGPDRLEISDRLTLRAVGWWARANGVPTVGFAHERVDGLLRAFTGTDRLPVRRLADVHNRATASCYDRIVATTAFAAEEFERIGSTNLVRIPLGVDLETFRPDRFDLALRDGLADRDEALVLLCSRLSKEKRPDVAVDAVRHLHEQGRGVRLVIAGTGPLAEPLERRIEGMPATLLGFVADRARLASLLATADVVIAPGPIETFGLAALEALASGTPVVAASTSALREVVTGSAGSTAEPSAQPIADAVAEVLGRPVAQRRAAARRRAEEFPWSRTVAGMLALHRDLGFPGRPGSPGRHELQRAS